MRRHWPVLPRLRDVLLLPGRYIRWKIIAPYALLTILIAATGTYIATRLVTGSLEERFENQLAEAARVTSDSVVRRERQHLEVVRGVALTEGVAAATEAGSSSSLASLVEPLAANNRTELVEVLDGRGQRLLGVYLASPESLQYGPISDAADRGSWTMVRNVLEGRNDGLGDKFAQIVQTTYGYAIYTAGPCPRPKASPWPTSPSTTSTAGRWRRASRAEAAAKRRT